MTLFTMQHISVRGARQHNLRNINLDIPRQALTVVTGLSGSGKSSLAFDTLYAEGQRRYIESLSTYARQFLEQMEKPDVDSVEGLSPAISIEQKTTSRNSRSTVGTITEVYDYLRLLFSSIGVPHCPKCGTRISRQSTDQIVDRILQLPDQSRVTILAPVVRERKGEFKNLFEKYEREGFVRARVDGVMEFLEVPPELEKNHNHTIEIVVDRLQIDGRFRSRIEESVRHALRMAAGLVLVEQVGGEEILFSERLACIQCGIDVPVLEPRSFSFNSKFGFCRRCQGLGSRWTVNLDRLVENHEKSTDEITLAMGGKELLFLFREASKAVLRHHGLPLNSPFEQFTPEVRRHLREGTPEEIEFSYADFRYNAAFEGITRWFEEKLERTRSTRKRQQLMAFMVQQDCPACNGARLRHESRAVKLHGFSISDYARLPLTEAAKHFNQLRLEPREEEVAGLILEEIRQRLGFLAQIGLDYLTLDRPAASLSSGEAQRVRLATQIGSQLRGVLYVLDEPSIGLHPRDTDQLLGALERLRDLGNTIIVVEHDEETILRADYVVDLGPGAGVHGGEVVVEGDLEEVRKCSNSITADYLTGRRSIEPPEGTRKKGQRAIKLRGVRHHNLKDIEVEFPLGLLITVTGVSGAGKSSLVDDVLYRALSRELYNSIREPGEYDSISGIEHIDKVVEIDQSPIGRTPRSNPATYTGVFTPVRQLFAQLPESKIRGYKPGRFSFNVKGGRCETCRGDGHRKIEMNFLPDVYVLCETCRGERYNRETLSVRYKGYSIADILKMSVEEALEILENIPPVASRLRTLVQVGLGYLTLGQSSVTLSGGEAQRVKLARELSKRSTGNTLYILDEPTTGLHFEDVRRLLGILHELVNLGNTVIIIEHNLDVIRCSDWIIDLGPEGGQRGGQVVVAGPPQEVARAEGSHTGKALAGAFALRYTSA